MTQPLTMSARVSAPAKTVHEAFTDPVQMRVWLAEHAEAELPDRYAFWGRHTLEGDAPRQRPLHVDDHTLRFAWPLAGKTTTVEIGLREETPGSTVVTVSQTEFDFSHPGSLGTLQTFWALSIANLVDHLEGRPLTPKPDYTSNELRADVLLAAPPAEVYDSLVDGAQVSRWFGFPVDIDARVGGQYGHGGRILDLDPGRALSIDWAGTGVFTWELAGSGGGTRLTLARSGFDAGQPPYAAWTGELCAVAELRRFHELADWQPIWLHDEHDSTAG
ncbi:SRPBCC family protein [Nonomuraea cavernae]|uniref:SRPBCC family protein n=1 Tax=Nonomuraea cavernae TaxID=2045107 RepID=UPI0033E45797